MKRNYISIGILVALIACVGGVLYTRSIQESTQTTLPPAPVTTPVGSITGVTEKATVSAATPSLSTSSAREDNVTLAIGSKLYGTYVSGSGSVLNLMHTLASTTDFTFTGKEYPSLGFFVTSIGGKKADDGYYWILYVNGKSSDLGASSATIHAGDTVEWRYEKGY